MKCKAQLIQANAEIEDARIFKLHFEEDIKVRLIQLEALHLEGEKNVNVDSIFLKDLVIYFLFYKHVLKHLYNYRIHYFFSTISLFF